MSVPDIVESGFILGISTLFLIIGVFHHFFNTAIGHAYSLNTDIRERSSMVYESFIQHGAYRRDRKHTGVYAEKRPCHYYGDQPRQQLVYGVTRARYADLHAVSSLQGPGAQGMCARVIGLCVQSLIHNTCAMQYAYKYAICLQNPTFILLRNQNLAFGTYQIQAPHGGVENTHVHVFTELVAVAGYYVGRQTVDTNCDVAVFPGSTPQLTLHVFFPFLEQVVCSICSTVHTT